MSSANVEIDVPGREVKIRSAVPADAERLRLWKNAQRRFFFHQAEIDSVQQRAWYAAYERREDDYMFIVEVAGRPAGCIGVRWRSRCADIYNVIAGEDVIRGRGLMTMALQAVLRFARSRFGDCIGLDVLKDNPAIAFYERNGFVVAADRGHHLEMKVDWLRIGER